MSENVCLMIIYNHRYDKNIEKVEKIYDSRFSDIYHIMPFYTGNKKNVIAVYESSFCFEGYVTQAMRFITKSYKQYLFIADDIILNPLINESNYREWFHVDWTDAYTTMAQPIGERGGWAIYKQSMDPLLKFERYNGTLWQKEIMSGQAAYFIAEQKGYRREQFAVDLRMVWRARKYLRQYPRLFILFFKILFLGKQYCAYPIWGGYSDIFIVPGEKMQEFAHMSGVFAAMRVFVEMAIPTALMLLCDRVVEEKDLPIKGKTVWSVEEKKEIEDRYCRKYDNLKKEWEENCLFIHPIKLSGWEV